MSQLVYIPSKSIPKFNGDPLRRDWNDFQHLSTQGRFVQPKIFSGFQNQRIKLATVKKQLYNPRVPSIRRVERDEVLCRLPDEHCRHTTSFTEEQFQNFDPKREESFIEFAGLNWHNTGKTLMGANDFQSSQYDSSTEFGSRLRADKSQKDLRLSQAKLYRTPTMSYISPSATLTKSIKYSYHNYGNATIEQNAITRSNLQAKSSFDSSTRTSMPKPAENVFRSSSMYVDVSSAQWKPGGSTNGNNDGSKSSRV